MRKMQCKLQCADCNILASFPGPRPSSQALAQVPRPSPRFLSLAVLLSGTASDGNLGEGLGTRPVTFTKQLTNDVLTCSTSYPNCSFARRKYASTGYKKDEL